MSVQATLTNSWAEPAVGPRRGGATLSPFFILRVAGEDIRGLHSLHSGETVQCQEMFDRLSERISAAKEQVTDILSVAVGRCGEDHQRRQAAIRLKRDIFNDRAPRTRDLEALSSLLCPSDRALVEEQTLMLAEFTTSDAALRTRYEGELLKARSGLAALLERPNLRGGIQASGSQLYKKMRAQLREPQPFCTGKEAHALADTLLHYLKRTTQKSSPFSSFTPLCIGVWSDEAEAGLEVDRPAMALQTRYALKPAFIMHCLEPVLRNPELAGAAFPLLLNPTLSLTDVAASWVQLGKSDYIHPRVWGHNPPRVNAPLSGPIRAVLMLYRRRGFEPARLESLTAELAALQPGLSVAEAKRLIVKLFSTGLLLPETGPLDQSDILPWAEHVLREIGGEGAAALIALEGIRDQAAAYTTADIDRRADVSEALSVKAKELARATEADLPEEVFKPILYEDCYVCGPRPELNPASIAPILSVLQLLLKLAPAFDFNTTMQAVLAARYVQEFGADGICDDPHEFLQRIDDEINGSGPTFFDLDRYRRLHTELTATPVGKALDQVRERFVDYLIERLDAGLDISIEPEFVRSLVAGLPQEVHRRPLSQCYAGQIAHAGDRPKLVLNQVFPGSANLMSRFFRDLSAEEIGRIQQYIAEQAEYCPAEISASFGFAANLHPGLTDFELTVPGHGGRFEQSRRLDIANLKLAYDAPTDRVYLMSTSGFRISPIYLGFLAPFYLPSPIRVLSMMNGLGLINFISGQLERRRLPSMKSPFLTPRISIGDVVLSRRTLRLPRAFLPDPKASDFDFFMAVQTWRRSHGLSSDEWLTLAPDMGSHAAAEAEQARAGRVDLSNHKPLQIHFSDPSSVRLFRRALARNDYSAVFQESLPELNDQHVKFAQKPHVAEIQLEISWRPEA